MKPKTSVRQAQRELFRIELERLVDEGHPLVKLGRQINWRVFEERLGQTYAVTGGAPGVSTRLMVALHYLKYQHDLSDESVVQHWVENPYWQHFSGEQFFQHEVPINPSSMTRWRHRLGEAGAEAMLKETIETAVRMKVITLTQIKRVNVDTTVQTKAVRYPTDARLYNRARERLVKVARERGIKIKQSYERVGARLVMQQSRYAHARQMNRARACTRKLRTQLGRVIRQVERSQVDPVGVLKKLLGTAQRIHAQQPTDKNKVYSVHEPEVCCIAKGKAGKKYEFGNKASVATTSRGGWMLGAMSLPGKPYDGHTLDQQLTQVRRLLGRRMQDVHVDMGYRGHTHCGAETEHVDKRRRGRTPKSLWRWMKRRAAVEPTIGHMKSEHRLERNRLKGTLGDAINAILSAAAMNFQKLQGFSWRFLLRLLDQLHHAIASDPIASSA